MSERVLPRIMLSKVGSRGKQFGAAVVLMMTAVGLASCGASLGNNFTASGSTSDPTAFAPTGATSNSDATSKASEAADKLTSAAKPGSGGYRIGPLDVLEVSVFNVPDLTKTVQVADDGTINYPLVGSVRAAGETTQQLEGELAHGLGAKYLRNPQVTVLVKDYNSQRVTVEGSVKTSGVYGIKGKTSLSQVLAMAGDVDTTVDSGQVVIFRTIDGTRSAARFDIDAIKAGKADDPPVEPGDVVVVDSSATKTALHNVLAALPLATTAAVFVPK